MSLVRLRAVRPTPKVPPARRGQAFWADACGLFVRAGWSDFVGDAAVKALFDEHWLTAWWAAFAVTGGTT